MRKTVFTFAFGAMIAPALLAAQDATKAVAGGGEVAPGWQMRIDPRAGSGDATEVRRDGIGLHATTGSRAIYWRTGDVGEGQLHGRARRSRCRSRPVTPRRMGSSSPART